MKNMKFRVRNEQHSKEIQEALFAKGYKWCYSVGYCNTEEKFIFTYNNGNLTHDNREQHFDEHCSKEHIVSGGIIYPLDSIIWASKARLWELPIDLRPKCVADSLRKREVLEAITRYVEADKKVPQEWLDEFAELNGRTK